MRHLHVDLDLIHRDIKPEKLFLPINHSGNFHGLKIADLGFCTTPENVTVSFEKRREERVEGKRES